MVQAGGRLVVSTPCSVSGCDRNRVARGYCGTHWARWRKHGDPRADVPVRSWGVGDPARLLVEVAWAAGFFDGEGSITFLRKRNRRGELDGRKDLRISLMQCDPRPLERFASAVSVGRVRGPHHRTRGRAERPYWCWDASGNRAAHVYGLIEPFLSEPKREQMARVLDAIGEQP